MHATVERPFFVRVWLGAIAASVVTFVAMLIVYHARATPYDNYVILANAFLHGHVWVDTPGPWIDALTYQGRQYIIEGPLPAVLLVPAVAIWGLGTNQTLLSYILTALAIGAGWGLAARLGVPWRSRLLLVLFLLLGTDLFFCGIFGDVWYIAHVSAVCFTLFALLELTGRKRAWIVLVFAVCAALSRFSLVLAIPVYIFVLMYGATPEERRGRAVSIFSIGVIAAALWLRYNHERWGVWYDIGYTAWYHQDPAGQASGSPFSLDYLPMQLYAFFVYPPVLFRGWPYVGVTQWATALPFTSPALILAFFARRPPRLGPRVVGSRRARRGAELPLLRRRIHTIWNAACTRLRALLVCADVSGFAARRALVGRRAVSVLGACRRLGILVLDNVRPSRLNDLLDRHGQLLATLVALLLAFAAAHGRSTRVR